MIEQIIHINDWDADVFVCYRRYDEQVLTEALRKVDAPISIIVRMREIARDDEYNTGFTYSDPRLRRSVVVIGKTTSPKEFMNTFVHEVRHLADDIASADGIALRGEEVAYLSGSIASSLSEVVGLFTCPNCQKSGVVGIRSAFSKIKK